jgi:hypothetical protein
MGKSVAHLAQRHQPKRRRQIDAASDDVRKRLRSWQGHLGPGLAKVVL